MNQISKIYPFKFLDSYTKDDKDFFFGREEETELLYQMLTQSDIVLVYGASGTGKTSLIQCGLSQKLNDYDWLPLYIRRGKDINQSLQNTLQELSKDDEQDSASDFLDQLLSDNEQADTPKSPVIKALQNIYGNYFKPVYLIFDQFEELYILGSKKEQQQFEQSIKEIVSANLQVKIILSIREEYLGYLYDFEKEFPQLLRKKIRIEPVNIGKVEKIVTGISQLKNSLVKIEENSIIDFAVQLFDKLKNPKELTIQLTYLQVALDKLYLKLTNDNKRQTEVVFTAQDPEKIGNIGNILIDFLEEQVKEIAKKLKNNYKSIDEPTIWKILSPFASLEGTKEPISEKDIQNRLADLDVSLIKAVISELIKRRILNYSETDELYEIVHDSLAKPIADKRSEEEIALLEVSRLIASQISINQEAREFFSEKQLNFIEPYLPKLKLSPQETALINDSRKHAEKLRKAEKKRQRMIIAIISVAAIISIAFGIFGFVNMRKAENSLNEAIKFQVLGKKKDAISFKEQEHYNAAIGKYDELLKIYRKFPQYKGDTVAVYKDIDECKRLDSISKIFNEKIQMADSLIISPNLEDIKKAYTLYNEAKNLSYKSTGRDAKITKFELKLEQVKKDLINRANLSYEAGGIGYDIAKSISEFLIKIDPDNENIKKLYKRCM